MHRRHFLTAALAAAALAPGRVAAQGGHGARVPLRFDRQRRPVAPIRINGRGPFHLVMDTAAQQTGLSGDLIRELGLTPNGQRAVVHGAGGATAVDLYSLGSVEIGPIRRENVIGLPLQHTGDEDAGHSGVLGAGMLAGTRTTFDYAGARLLVQVGERRPPLPGAVDVQLLYDLLILAPAHIGEASVAAVLDTGARHSVGNPALQAALRFAANDPRLRPVPPVGGVTTHAMEARAGAVAGVRLGGVQRPDSILRSRRCRCSTRSASPTGPPRSSARTCSTNGAASPSTIRREPLR